ncbi:MAG: double-strand break repair protein AddB [Methylovirgula sp.]|jgi:ATP-dependent helicase/nuclease subunit B
MPSSTVFTIAPGAPFLKTFVEALLDGRIVAGFSRDLPPLALADATIYVPTQRAARALVQEFASTFDRPATLLPRILPLGALDATETALLFEEASIDYALAEDVPQAATEIWRRMHLAHLISEWARTLRHAIVSIDEDGAKTTDPSEPCLVGTSPLDAFALAGDLADLIDELIIEDVPFAALDPLATSELDAYWRITLDFLAIAITSWPAILKENDLVDAAFRRARLVEKQIGLIEAGSQPGPVIAIGSTGTNSATARLLSAIARAPQGAVVLPGLDRDLDEEAWQQIANHRDGGLDSAFGHPQAALARLLSTLKVTRDAVVELGSLDKPCAIRGRLISEALRPAETTDHWPLYRTSVPSTDLATALADVAFIDAADEREEALALAIGMREILEEPGKTAALVTPDRTLARRVAAELGRFGLAVEDSAGEPLSASAYGILARLVAACGTSGLAGGDIIALLAHPLTSFGALRAEIERLAPLFEIGVLRQPRALTRFANAQEAIAWARRQITPRSHPAQKRITDEAWTKIEQLAAQFMEALAPLSSLRGMYGLDTWVAAHREALDRVTKSDESAAMGEDHEVLDALFDELFRCAPAELTFSGETYLAFFSHTAAATALRTQKKTHPRLKILGLLEARLIDADLILLGGLDETIWPPEARSDAFLNRPMRATLGLSPPERKIGQTAHDFIVAMGAPRVILSRAHKRDGSPMVASRFIQRLSALTGDAFDDCRARGAHYLALAQALDRPLAPTILARPLPRPTLSLRPQGLSVTRIEVLRRDPYAIYAEFILRLIELPALAAPLDRRSLGTMIHDVLATFCNRWPSGPLPPEAPAHLTRMLRETFAEDFNEPEFAAFIWPRIEAAASFYLSFEADRRDELEKIDVETWSSLDIKLDDGSIFTLSGTADRLEHRRDGTVTIIDYKTGTPPSMKEVFVGFAPQLTLEAAMAKRGAFGVTEGTEIAEAMYVKLIGDDGGKELPLNFTKSKRNKDDPTPTVAEVAEVHFASLLTLLNQFRDETTPYPPRPFPKFTSRFSVYDHLARVKEWSLGAEKGGEP